MKPPLRASSHCTSRTLETRASRMRPTTSKRMVSPTPIRARSCSPCSIDTSASAAFSASARLAQRPERAVDHLLVRLEVVAVGDRELAPQPALPDVLEASRGWCLLPRTPVTRARITGNQPRRAGRRRLARVEERAHRVDLGRQDLDQEHVGPARRQLERELLQQVGLQRADADDEEAADADGEQDDAGLVAGTRQVEDGVAQRKPARARHRPDGADDAPSRRRAAPARRRRTRRRRSARRAATPPAIRPPRPARRRRATRRRPASSR